MPRYRVRRVTAAARTAFDLNRLAAQAGARTLVQRAGRGPRHTRWSLPYASIVELMTLGTPSHDIRHAGQIRDPLDRVTLLSKTMPMQRELVSLGDFDGEWVSMPRSRPERVILFLHGGGYVSGSPRSHRALIGHLAQQVEARVFAPDYRLAPEYPFPAALEDAWASYWWLLVQGIAPGQIVVGGDSAGGGLTIALMLALREAGMPLPAAGICLSPWFDLALTGGTMATNRHTDYLNDEVLHTSARMYLNGHDAHDPLVSPLYADLRALPPLLLQVGTAEMLLDDGRRFARRARAAGVDVSLELWPDMVHVWHFTYLIEPRAREAVQSIGHFVRRHVKVGA